VIVGLVVAVIATAGSFGITRAQAQATAPLFPLDHFLGYKFNLSSQTPWTPITVGLGDQFEPNLKPYIVTRPIRLFNPVRKYINAQHSSGVFDPEAHLKGYEIRVPDGLPVDPVVKNLLVHDQFGHFIVDTQRPVMVLVPTAKEIGIDPEPYDPAQHQLDHFKCYAVKVNSSYNSSGIFGLPVFLRDQFKQGRAFKVGAPTMLCNPTRKQHGDVFTGVQNADAHLICHKVKPITPLNPVRNIRTMNQFGYERLNATGEEELCAPARKLHHLAMPDPVFEPAPQ
jgi:hypothetical protein